MVYSEKTLSSGLRLLSIPMGGTETATILVLVGTGSKYESRRLSGLSHFLEHMFFKGTRRRPTALALSSELDSLGAEYNAFTSREFTGYWIKVAHQKLDQAIDIVSDMLSESRFAAAEIERERGVIIEEFNMYQDNPNFLIDDIFEECLYGNQPAGWDTIGTKENIKSFSRRDFLDYFQAQYAPHNTVVAVAGRLGSEAVLARKIERYFGRGSFAGRGRAFREKPPVDDRQSSPAIRVKYKKTDQVHLALGVRAFPYHHPDGDIAKLLAIILGGSMSSRLFISLRERKGLAYSVRTSIESYTDSGYLYTRAGVPVAKAEEAIDTIMLEYRRIAKSLVPEAELKRALDLIQGWTTIQMEASDDQAVWYARQAVMRDTIARTDAKAAKRSSVIDPGRYLKDLRRIKPADLRRVARLIFRPENLNLAIIGPMKDGKSFEKYLKF
jgi:predicted Zn-dependent peptidase